jgi:hypothetical protein
MTTFAQYHIGDTYTTAKSGYTGQITDIIHRNGRIVLEMDSGLHYTTLA